MPLSKEKMRERKRQGRVKPVSNLTGQDVKPIDPEWQHVKDWLLADPGVGMNRLERLQRIAGSLGKLADDVWFGGLTMGDIGRVIGVKGALV